MLIRRRKLCLNKGRKPVSKQRTKTTIDIYIYIRLKCIVYYMCIKHIRVFDTVVQYNKTIGFTRIQTRASDNQLLVYTNARTHTLALYRYSFRASKSLESAGRQFVFRYYISFGRMVIVFETPISRLSVQQRYESLRTAHTGGESHRCAPCASLAVRWSPPWPKTLTSLALVVVIVTFGNDDNRSAEKSSSPFIRHANGNAKSALQPPSPNAAVLCSGYIFIPATSINIYCEASSDGTVLKSGRSQVTDTLLGTETFSSFFYGKHLNNEYYYGNFVFNHFYRQI